MRIVSLLPSATEMVCGLGLADTLVGISHCCDYPQEITHLPVLTTSVVDKDASSIQIDETVREHLQHSSTLYALDVDKLAALKPDVVVTQALCDVCAVNGADVEQAVAAIDSNPKIVNMEPFCLQDVLDTLINLGQATGTADRAAKYMDDLRTRIEAVKDRSDRIIEKPRVMVLDWVDPPFVSGHWMHDMITLAGGIDCMGTADQPSYSTDWESVMEEDIDALIIACCGFPEERTLAEIAGSSEAATMIENLRMRGIAVHVVDGNGLFSRPGPRLVDSLELLAHLLHPSVHPAVTPPL